MKKRKKDKFKDAYDQKCIEILSYKVILANIMKQCIREYQDFNISTIIIIVSAGILALVYRRISAGKKE